MHVHKKKYFYLITQNHFGILINFLIQLLIKKDIENNVTYEVIVE